MDDEDKIVICMTWDKVVVAGSTKVLCTRCEAVCGISPATLAELAPGKPMEGARVHCLSCAKKIMPKDAEVQPITLKQFREFLRGYEREGGTP